jgi:hypothetical protein
VRATYSEQRPQVDSVCDDCGEPADVLFVCDFPDAGTGYVDGVHLCLDCLSKREGSEPPEFVPVQ